MAGWNSFQNPDPGATVPLKSSVRIGDWRIFLSVFGENIPTAEFGMVFGRNCFLGHRKKIAKVLMSTFTCRSLSSISPRIGQIYTEVKYGGRFTKFIWVQCHHSCTHWLRPRNSPPPPHLDSFMRIFSNPCAGRYWSAKVDDISLPAPLSLKVYSSHLNWEA